jgi:hypothetical protein
MRNPLAAQRLALLASQPVDNASCIFCGLTGATVKITGEHSFSDWINQVLTVEIVGPDITCERSIVIGPQAGTADSWPARKIAAHKLRAVCRTCNGGWMSLLEQAVRPLIEPMIRGYNAPLTTEQQLTVATWGAMKAAVFEYVWGDERVLSTADREVIRTQARPPASVQVRLAAVESNGYPLRAFGRVYELRAASKKAICLTTTIGCLITQVYGGPGAGNHEFQALSRSGPDFIGIWPPQMRPVQWPPARALDDVSVVNFAHPLAARTAIPSPQS